MELAKIEKLTAYVCDDLCRHPREAVDQEELDGICAECLVGEYRYWLLRHAEPKEAEDAPSWKENFMQRFQKVV